MKHINCMTRPMVGRAQDANSIITIVGTVLSSIGALLLTVAPLISKGAR